MKFAFIRDLDEAERRKPRAQRIPVSVMCDVLEVSRSGYYAWQKRDTAERARDDAELTGIITQIHEEHEGRLGIACRPRA